MTIIVPNFLAAVSFNAPCLVNSRSVPMSSKSIFLKRPFLRQVLHDGKYGTVCDDSWDIVDANVVCRTLNMGNATKAVIRAGFGAGRDPVWLDEVKCLGESVSHL